MNDNTSDGDIIITNDSSVTSSSSLIRVEIHLNKAVYTNGQQLTGYVTLNLNTNITVKVSERDS